MGILRCDIGRISSSFFLSPPVFNDFKQVAFSPDFVLRRPAGMSGALSFHRHLCDAFKVNLPDFLSDSFADDRLHLLPACAQHPCPASGDAMRGHFSLLLFFSLSLLFVLFFLFLLLKTCESVFLYLLCLMAACLAVVHVFIYLFLNLCISTFHLCFLHGFS